MLIRFVVAIVIVLSLAGGQVQPAAAATCHEQTATITGSGAINGTAGADSLAAGDDTPTGGDGDPDTCDGGNELDQLYPPARTAAKSRSASRRGQGQ